MVRLKDIAERAKVSVNTVSRVMRDAPDVSQATKLRVRQLAKAMGYVPDSMAQSLRSRTTKLLGLVISTTTDPVFSRMVMAIEERAHALGYDVILAHSLNIPEREEEVIRRLLSRRVDGLMISPVYRLEPRAPIYQEIANSKTPVVILGQNAPFSDTFVNVETDDLGASSAATQHLIELGHRKIAFLSGPPAAPHAHERFEGYKHALREAGLEVEEQLVFKAGSTIEEGEHAALQMLNEKCPATAVFAVNDLVAIGAGTVFLSQGIAIPKDISIVGFGNVLLSEHFRVPLTTVRQPKLRLGAVAMDMMETMLQGTSVQSKRLHAELITRDSSAPPPPK